MVSSKCPICGSSEISSQGFCMSCGTALKQEKTQQTEILNYRERSYGQGNNYNGYEQDNSYYYNSQAQGNYNPDAYAQSNFTQNNYNQQMTMQENAMNTTRVKKKKNPIVIFISAFITLFILFVGISFVSTLVSDIMEAKENDKNVEIIQTTTATENISKPAGVDKEFTKVSAVEGLYENYEYYKIVIEENDEKYVNGTVIEQKYKYNIYVKKDLNVKNITNDGNRFTFYTDEGGVFGCIYMIFDDETYDTSVADKFKYISDNNEVKKVITYVYPENIKVDKYEVLGELNYEHVYLTQSTQNRYLFLSYIADNETEKLTDNIIDYIEVEYTETKVGTKSE